MTPEQAYEFALLVLCIWREARGESLEAQCAVAWVIKNRVTQGGWWGKTYAEVVLKPFQFSSFNGPDKNGHVDANATKFPVPSTDPAYGSCLLAAKRAYEGTMPDPTHGSQYYHDTSIKPPAWTATMKFTVGIGSLLFYRQG